MRTSIGDFVRHEGHTPFVEYYLFRPDHNRVLAEFIEKARAREETDHAKAYKQLRRIGLLMLALDKYGLNAYLFLDRTLVEEEELETLIQETYGLLNTIPIGPEGGSLSVQWMEEIVEYSLNPAER